MKSVGGTFWVVLCLSGILFARESKAKLEADGSATLHAGVESGAPVLKGISSILMGEYLNLLSEDTLDLAKLRGKATVVDLRPAWGAPCKVEIPDLIQFALKITGRRDITLVIVSRDAVAGEADQKQAKDFLNRMNVNYAVVTDDRGQSLIDGDYSMFPGNLFFENNRRVVKVLSSDDPLGEVREYLETKK